MTRGEAQILIKAQSWTLNVGSRCYELYRIDRNGIYRQLKEALGCLGMGYYGGFLGIKDRETEKWVNLHVFEDQFRRGDICVNDLKIIQRVNEPEVKD